MKFYHLKMLKRLLDFGHMYREPEDFLLRNLGRISHSERNEMKWRILGVMLKILRLNPQNDKYGRTSQIGESLQSQIWIFLPQNIQ